jgi:riboflavin synthase
VFTGLIEEIGEVIRSIRSEHGRTLGFRAAAVTDGLKADDSVSCGGVCLTVIGIHADGFSADAVEETLDTTTVGSWKPGTKINLERAMRAEGRFGGHFVQGHVDGTGKVSSIRTLGDAKRIRFEVPSELGRSLVSKGSVTVDGVSLTVAEAAADGFTAALIPHTLQRTTLGRLKPGDRVNLETDVLGKYVERFLRGSRIGGTELDEKRMRELGY